VTPVSEFRVAFVDVVPQRLDAATLYVSIRYGSATHSCPCGCGHEVVTPLGRWDWKLIVEGEKVSLCPSIGNWSLPCQSHYWIRRNRVVWARRWSRSEIALVRARDAARRLGRR
jgi:hypothetical protein